MHAAVGAIDSSGTIRAHHTSAWRRDQHHLCLALLHPSAHAGQTHRSFMEDAVTHALRWPSGAGWLWKRSNSRRCVQRCSTLMTGSRSAAEAKGPRRSMSAATCPEAHQPDEQPKPDAQPAKTKHAAWKQTL